MALFVYRYGESIAGLGSPGSFFHPTFPGHQLWLMADLGMTLSSGRVVAWADQTPNARNFYRESDGSMGPVLDIGVTNGHNQLRNDSAASRLAGPGMNGVSALAAGGEIWAVMTIPTAPPAAPWRFGSELNDEVWNAPGWYSIWGSTARKATGYGPRSGLTLINITSIAGEWTLRINGAQVYTTATNSVGWSTLSRFMGGSGAGAPYGSDGLCANCLIVTAGKASTTDRGTMNAALIARYAIS
jgi:hypothetical protein